ncbi:MAG: hypothetical protein ABW219_01850 [Ilumatobacteraceae bacterium]
MTLRNHLGRSAPFVIAMTAGAAAAIVGSLLAWIRTGGARRNSYDLFAVVGRLGFAPDGPMSAAVRWWPLVPLLAVVAVVAAWWGWPRLGGALGVIAAAYAGGVATAVSAAPAASEVVDVQHGAPLTAVGGLVLLVGSVGCVVVGFTAPTDLAP